MKQIYKHILEILPVQRLGLPTGSKFLSVEEQYGNIVVYTLVDFEDRLGIDIGHKHAGRELFDIFVKKTGEPAYDMDNCKFLGTVKLDGGRLMFHVFYKQVKK
ncbi:unnamed protein product [marine sediment metagenome]|uniref:DUF7352 domain-containing protein n=1 Tax=marine sediment metagenome TaxID=412755 RepID=X1I7T2_9ZZZZ